MSAQEQFRYAQEAIHFGASEYLVKPFLEEDIIAALEKVIEKRNKQSAGAETPEPTTKKNTSPLRAIIVDDEKAQRSALRYKVEETFGERVALVGEAFSVDSAIAVIKEHQPELVFLDIDLIGGTGFDVLDAFANPNFAVIFVTSYPEFGARAFRYDAIDFILKPIDPAHLQKAVERVFSLRNVGVESNVSPEFISPEQTTSNAPKEKSWTIKAKDRTVYILEWEQIVHLQADGKYAIVYHTKGKPFLIAKTLQECSQELPETVFYQTHRSHIINRTYFSHARDGFAFLSNGERVDVATRIWTQFLSAMKK
jgi:two-component system LytT family response regulator